MMDCPRLRLGTDCVRFLRQDHLALDENYESVLNVAEVMLLVSR